MLRPAMKIMIPLALASVAAGCATFSDNDAVARVNGVELSQSDFEQRVRDLGVTEQDVVSLDGARLEITDWIGSQLVDEALIAENYDAGVAVGGSVCINAIIVDDQEIAESRAEELAAGADFEEVFAAANIDPNIAADLGAVPCITESDLQASESMPLVAAARQLSVAEPISMAPLLDETNQEIGYAVIVFRSYDSLAANDIDIVTAAAPPTPESAAADIYVDPRYGTFDATTGQVVGLG